MKNPEGELSSYLFTDLQKSTHSLNEFVPDSSLSIRFLPDVASQTANIYVDSIWFDTPVRLLNAPEKLNVRIRHNASEALENIPMSLVINGQQKAIGSFNLVPGLDTDTALFFTTTSPGLKACEVQLDDHPVSYDDNYFFGYNVAKQVTVLLVKGNSTGAAFKTIFSNDPFYDLTVSDLQQINYSEINRYDLVVLDQPASISSGLVQELSQFVTSGGTVLLIPEKNADKPSYNEFLLALNAPTITLRRSLQTKVAEIDLEATSMKGCSTESLQTLIYRRFNSFSFLINLPHRKNEVY